MNKKFIFKIIICSFFALLNCTDEFLAQEPKKTRSLKKQYGHQIKEEIAQYLADIAMQTAKAIEIQAQIQQKIFKQIDELISNNKNSFFVKAQKQELQDYLNKLKDIKNNNAKELDRLLIINKDLLKK